MIEYKKNGVTFFCQIVCIRLKSPYFWHIAVEKQDIILTISY